MCCVFIRANLFFYLSYFQLSGLTTSLNSNVGQLRPLIGAPVSKSPYSAAALNSNSSNFNSNIGSRLVNSAAQLKTKPSTPTPLAHTPLAHTPSSNINTSRHDFDMLVPSTIQKPTPDTNFSAYSSNSMQTINNNHSTIKYPGLVQSRALSAALNENMDDWSMDDSQSMVETPTVPCVDTLSKPNPGMVLWGVKTLKVKFKFHFIYISVEGQSL